MSTETDTKSAIPVEPGSCSIAEPCDSGCCDDHPASADVRAGRAGWKVALFGALCLAGCLAGPLLAGGLATASGAISGELGLGLLIAAIVIGVALVRRSRSGKPIC